MTQAAGEGHINPAVQAINLDSALSLGFYCIVLRTTITYIENLLDLTNNSYEKFDELLNEFNNSTDHCRVL